jgi:hypothetical protein
LHTDFYFNFEHLRYDTEYKDMYRLYLVKHHSLQENR